MKSRLYRIKPLIFALLIAAAFVLPACAGLFPRDNEAAAGKPASETAAPSAAVTETPTAEPAAEQSAEPTENPTMTPTEAPTEEPSPAPAETPEAATEAPTQAPTEKPTAKPTHTPKPTAAPAPTERPTERPTEKPTASPTRTPKPEGTPRPPQDPSDITMMFVGDLMCLSGQQYAAMHQASGGESYDFRPSFAYVKPIISRADCAVGNLETVLSPSWPLATEEKEIDGMPNCNGPAEYLDALKYAGFDALALANNHCCDAGRQGILETLDAVDSRGFRHTGLFRSESEKRFTVLNVNGIRVGFISYAEFYNHKEGCVAESPYMINTYSQNTARRDIQAAREAGAEFIIVYEHWGREHTHEPTELQLKHAKQLADAGADVICGSHSHTVQPTEWITAEDGRQVLCIYSMGNFVSSMSQSAANDTVIMELRIGRSGGRVVLKDEVYHPCRVIRQTGGKAFVVVPTSETSIPSIRAELEAAEERIMRIIMKNR